jgi:hypothetical protein
MDLGKRRKVNYSKFKSPIKSVSGLENLKKLSLEKLWLSVLYTRLVNSRMMSSRLTNDLILVAPTFLSTLIILVDHVLLKVLPSGYIIPIRSPMSYEIVGRYSKGRKYAWNI